MKILRRRNQCVYKPAWFSVYAFYFEHPIQLNPIIWQYGHPQTLFFLVVVIHFHQPSPRFCCLRFFLSIPNLRFAPKTTDLFYWHQKCLKNSAPAETHLQRTINGPVPDGAIHKEFFLLHLIDQNQFSHPDQKPQFPDRVKPFATIPEKSGQSPSLHQPISFVWSSDHQPGEIFQR